MTSKRWNLVIACGLVAAAGLGCQQAEEIQRYQVAREPRMRMLAAIIPHGDKTWFVKVTGPDPTVEQHKPAFIGFLESFRFDDKAKPPLTWLVPKDWKQDNAKAIKGDFQRFATFRLPGQEGEDLELTVFALGKDGMAGDVLANVNRWRGQLGLEPIKADELKGVTQALEIGSTKATVVDMLGTSSRLIARRPRFAGGAEPKEQAAAAAVPPTFEAPKGWQKAPLKPFSIATFQVGNGEQPLVVTVTPAAGSMADNLNRWRDQVGLPPGDRKELEQDLRELKLADERPAVYVEYIGPEGKANRAALFGAITAGPGQRIWFFKMIGPADAVIHQRAAFQEFLHSVRFAGGKEGHP